MKHRRIVSVLIAIAFALTIIAPVFVAPAPAVAATTYEVWNPADIAQVGDKITNTKIYINISNIGALATNDVLTIGLPAGTKINTFNVSAPLTLDNGDPNNLNAGKYVAYPVGTTLIEIKMNLAASDIGPGCLVVSLTDVEVNKVFDGDIKATFNSPGTGFPTGSAVIAKFIGSNTATYSGVPDVVPMGSDATKIETLVLQEIIKNSVKDGEVIKYKLPPGFKWVTGTDSLSSVAMWGWSGRATFTPVIDSTDDRILKVTAAITGSGEKGRLYTKNAYIVVDDDSVAKKGDVVVHVYSDKGNVTEQDIVVATYKDYEVIATGKTVKDVLAGEYDTTVGSINIKESLAGSLLKNRNVTITLPKGVKWDTENYSESAVISAKVISGTNWVQYANPRVDSSGRKLTLTVSDTTTSTSDIDLEKLRVVISPDFVGDLNVEVGGNAGVEPATLKVANVKAPVEMKAEGDIPKAVIGMQAQKIADVTVTEAAKEAIEVASDRDTIAFELPDGVAFDALPTVTVTDGDLVIDSVSFESRSNKSMVLVEIKSMSTKPSTIKLSNMKVTIDRTVPEGDLKLAIDALESTALQNACTDPTPTTDPDLSFDVDSMASVAVAKVVTPAGTQGRSATFYIGSTIMNVNGANVIMDTAPYIKNSRTYVPVRYLAEALGANVVWDEATKTVTITKGDKTIVLVIGSKTAKVNGVDVAMDVAPEITNNRTMLPARYVAEGLGFQVGWNQALQQVVVQEVQ